ncbi:hypothetical protein CICLE_v10010285mg, partial [Citrus x clementina]
MESEFIALAAAGKEAEWLRNLLFDIMLWPQPMPSISLYYDSEATLSRAYNKVYNGKSRHISLRHEYVKQLIADGVINIVYVKTNKNLADPLTKGLSRDLVKDTSFGMGLKPLHNKVTNDENRYVGILYKSILVKTVFWVANRLKPINDSSGLLTINRTGNPVLTSLSMGIVWSASLSEEVQQTPVILQLLDSRNLILKGEQDGDSENYFWQSFDYPSDTLLPGMKLGWDLKTGLERRVTSWKSLNDPSPGDLIWKIERQGNHELVMWKGSTKFYRTGPWNGVTFSASSIKPNPIFNSSFVSNEDELYYTYILVDKVVFSRTLVNQTLSLCQRFVWSKATQSWELYTSVPRDQCDTYNLCGAYGICSISKSPVCQCLKGFKPKSEVYVERSQGCVRTKPLNYSRRDGFVKFNDLKLPDSTSSWVSKSMNLNECREKCLDNSSCMAYTNSDIRGEGSGCAMWFGDLIDIRYFQDSGQDLYIRMSASELDLELPLFELATIVSATNNFSINKKLGQGGFGPFYKVNLKLASQKYLFYLVTKFTYMAWQGTLVDGQEIAVKRLSKISEQGLKELKNEVILFSKLQHRNLVKLLGCCIQGEEKLLIYEFMPNKSLDSFIF